MMEGLGQYIKHAKVTGKIQGLQLSENGQALTHQQFVDDTMLSGILTVKEAFAYNFFLNDFAMATGMEVNLSKSIFFFFNTHIAIQRNVSRIIGFQRESLPSRSLNLVGRLVLTNAVLQAIPVFMLSALPAPKGVLQQFRNIQRDFIWGKEETRKKWALVTWEKICKPKNQGGLGLDDLEILSKVLGAKIWWQWVKDPKAQWESI
eukprot:PITA_06478